MPSSSAQSPIPIERTSSTHDPRRRETIGPPSITLPGLLAEIVRSNQIMDTELQYTEDSNQETSQAISEISPTASSQRTASQIASDGNDHEGAPSVVDGVVEGSLSELPTNQAPEGHGEVPEEQATPTTDQTPAQSTPQPISTDASIDPPQDSEDEATTSPDAMTVPSWVEYEEDMTIPDEEEMKEIEGSDYDKLSALDISAMEEQFYTDIDDPDQRPTKKIRLSWVIKGVRGTRERPNMARVINSPGACVDGLYWSIKFYPRGDQCSSLSAFVRCSREPPPVDDECPESDFSFFEGPPETDFASHRDPMVRISVPAKDRIKTSSKAVKGKEVGSEEPTQRLDWSESQTSSDSPLSTTQGVIDGDGAADKCESSELPNWRISAQLGMVIYNPVEPRTGHLQSDGHQFSKHCDDWGWVNFVGPWDEIHKRKRGQRQALLRNDTLAIDAYIRIYHDPTEALWWHESKDETQWPSKELAGYFSMGTPGLYHSPAVAGITAWMLLAPFRGIIQSVDGGRWRTDAYSDPKPLICQSQLVLDQMRHLTSDCYVNVYKMIEEFLEVEEKWNDVSSFWEVFRRGLELELADNPDAQAKLSSIFDANGTRWKTPSLPVIGSPSVRQSFADFLDDTKYHGPFPDFMPIMLNRSEFDFQIREWKLHHDRVHMNDELNLAKWSTDADSAYTLYGFMVHVGTRNSGKFYSVLRPGGIGTKWLAFEDGNGNKVFSYSKRRIQEYEGLEGEDLRKFPTSQTRENAYLVMYVRTSCFKSYLPGGLEPYRVSKWLKPWADDPRDDDGESQVHQEIAAQSPSEAQKQQKEGIQIQLILDECAEGTENMLRLHDLRTSEVAKEMSRTVTVSTEKTFKDLRCAIATALEAERPIDVQMWEIHYQGLGKFSRAILEPIAYRRKIVKSATPGQIFLVWVSVQQPIGQKISYKDNLNRLNQINLTKDFIEMEDDDDDTLGSYDPERLAAMTDAAQQESASTNATPEEANESTIAAPDAEQQAVEAAVEADLLNAAADQQATDSEAEPSVTPASTEQSESSEGEDGMMTPTSSVRSITVTVSTEVPSTIIDHVTPSDAISAQDEDESARAVVHGHLVDAAEHTNVAVGDLIVTHASAIVPHGDVGALLQVLTEEIPLSLVGSQIENTTQAERESQNRTPTQYHVARAYGNIQLFDADQQKFVAQRPFHPELVMKIGAAVREQLSYPESRQFRIWRRAGATGTEPIQPDSTFVSVGIQDVFTLIVGETLSETKVDELKAAGKFWQPQQLIAYLGMLKRKHPYSALTSTEPVELADFGNDYYKGPLSRGRPHGQKGYLITSTGHTYEGPFVAGQKSGSNGLMTYQNGDVYVGEWLNDERHGQGEHTEKRTGNRYIGGFENGKRWGRGTTHWQVADQQADMCQICYEEEIDALFYDCGHVCACVTCAKQCDSCPICRRGVRQVVKMYRA